MADEPTSYDPLGDWEPGEPPAWEHADGYPDEPSPFEPADSDGAPPAAHEYAPAPDEVPPSYPDDTSDAEPFTGPVIPAQRRGPSPDDVREETLRAWFSVAAAALQNGSTAQRAQEIIGQMRSADPLYRVLGEDTSLRLKAALRTVEAILTDIVDDGEVWLDQMGVFDSKAPSAKNLRGVFEKIANTMPATAPESALGSALFTSRKTLSRDSAARLVRAIDAGEDPESLGKIFGEILPPSAIEGSQTSENKSLTALFDDTSKGALMTLSSGFRTLDVALHTRKKLPMGFIRGGQLVVMVAPSGAGKTSTMFGTVLPAMTSDMVKQGHRGRLIFIHNEDETVELFADAGISPGGRYGHLTDSIVALKTTSRSEAVKTFYLEVLRAKRLSAETGLPVQLFMPGAFVIDYFQALSDAGESETEATGKTADMLLYGIANCDPIALATTTGISFQSFTGEAWPDGVSGYNLPVLSTAQLLLKGVGKPYDPNDSNADWRHYATDNGKDEPAWEVKAGDFPLAKLDHIRGSTKIIQHATTIVALHRSRPRDNPVARVDENGWEHLQDTRGYFTILKARYGQNLVVIPMEFNRQRNGGDRAQYIDARAEKAMTLGKLTDFDQELFRQSGDVILPVRPKPSRMKERSYQRIYRLAGRRRTPVAAS